MKIFCIRLLKLLIGLFLFSLGIVFTFRANIGYAPWDVFHSGISNKTGISIGTASIIVGLALLIIVKLSGEKLGLGTVFNMFFIGMFIDFLLKINIIPKMENIVFGIIMLIIGLFILSIGSYFYMISAFGAGPRDNLMVVLTRRTKIPVGICRSIIEISVTLIGWLLGGMIGFGTVIAAIGVGFCIQITFRVLKFDVKAVKHETFGESIAALVRKIKNRDE